VLWRCWLGARKSIWPVKSWAMKCWCGYLSGTRYRLFAYGPADVSTVPKPNHLLLHLNLDWFCFLVPAYPGCPGKEAVKRVVVVLIIITTTTMFVVLSPWTKPPGSFDVCSLSAGWPPTPDPSQLTWAASLPKTGSYRHCYYHSAHKLQ